MRSSWAPWAEPHSPARSSRLRPSGSNLDNRVAPAEPPARKPGFRWRTFPSHPIDLEGRGMAEPQSGNEPIGGHPESVDPPWFQELVRRAFEREMRRHQKPGAYADVSRERANRYRIDPPNNLAH